jgi:hypothetical protein
LPLLSLPKRKRNSASSSSSSSGSSSTPHTPQHSMIFQSPQTSSSGSQDLIQTSPPANLSSVTNQGTSPHQLLPMVKLAAATTGKVGQGSQPQPMLVPAYQQPPVMMILANTSSSSSPTNWVTVPTSTTTSSPAQHQLVATNSAGDKARRTAVEQDKSNGTVPDAQVNTTPPSSSSNTVEDQLRLQIAHLQQQLYQSQLAAARVPQLMAVSQTVTDVSPGQHRGRLDQVVSNKHVGKNTHGAMVMQSPSLHKLTLQHSPPTLNGGGGMDHGQPVGSVPFSPPELPQALTQRAIHMQGGNNGITMGTGGVTMETAQPVPQYIPIPVVPAQEYLYMSQ